MAECCLTAASEAPDVCMAIGYRVWNRTMASTRDGSRGLRGCCLVTQPSAARTLPAIFGTLVLQPHCPLSI
jgi:hypothetical protein